MIDEDKLLPLVKQINEIVGEKGAYLIAVSDNTGVLTVAMDVFCKTCMVEAITAAIKDNSGLQHNHDIVKIH